ncbi:MAG: HAD-IIA family hydrolase [Limnochordaceae bacterium]|nr:HAD-IIA family hydrolase [Limnochordaceae bacterium]
MAAPAWIVDLDGVVWRQGEAIPGAARFFEAVRARGQAAVVVSNNSAPTVETYLEQLRAIGIPLERHQVVSSGMAAARYLVDQGIREGVLAVGEAGLFQALREAGIEALPAGQPVGMPSARVQAVVVGIDRSFTYAKLEAACRAIRAGSRFVATNPDLTVPARDGGVVPGCGALVAAVAACSGVRPVVVGKPERPILELALARLGVREGEDRSHVVVVGDRLDTDVTFARRGGLTSALVLTGITRREDLDRSEIRPDYVFEDLGALAEALAGG